MTSFSGQTVMMSGGSRGIGLEIALRLAADGANVALIAKTDTPHPKLPGTIHTAAAEIEAAGGNALPIVGDVRDEAGVDAAVAAGGRPVRRDRHRRQQRLGDQPRADGRPRGQALRPDAADQRPRHVRAHARVPAAPASVVTGAGADAVAAAHRRPQVAARPLRLHAVEDGHDDADAGAGVRRGRTRDQGQLPVAANADRDRRGPEPARRRRGDAPGADPRDLRRRGLSSCSPPTAPARR